MSCIRTFIFLCTFIVHDAVLLHFTQLSGAGRFKWVRLVIDIYVWLGSASFFWRENLVFECVSVIHLEMLS
jgi:hypothetical protein